jgi:signal transduction histidine kinase
MHAAPEFPARTVMQRARFIALLAILPIAVTFLRLSLLGLDGESTFSPGAILADNTDILTLAAGAGIVVAALGTWAAKLRVGRDIKVATSVLAAVLLAAGSGRVVGEGEQARTQMRSSIEGFAPTYSAEMRARGHWRLASDAGPDDPLYLDLIETEKRWLAHNPGVADIYTMRRDPAGKWRFIVDSETDYNHSGVIDDEREERTAPGEPLEIDTSEIEAAAAGKHVFQDHPETDRWGTWVSAFVPILDEAGSVEGVLGVDFPAENWNKEIAHARLGVIGYLGGGLALLFGAAALQIAYRRHIKGRIENESHLRAKAEELQQARIDADAANQAKSEFLANMTHEIRTPMTAIMGYLDMIIDPDLPPTLRESHAKTIKRSGRHLLSIINNILDYSKIGSGKLTVECIPCNLTEIVDDAMALMRSLAENRGIAFNVEWQDGVPRTIRSDPMRLREVLINIVGNAIKYTEEGGVQVTISFAPACDGVPSLFFAVRDSGIGLTPEQAAGLFQPFKQADSSHSRRFGGTGLGLVISKSFAELMGGTIEVQSTAGVGSTFTISIAANVAESTEAPAAAQGHAAASNAEHPERAELAAAAGTTN